MNRRGILLPLTRRHLLRSRRHPLPASGARGEEGAVTSDFLPSPDEVGKGTACTADQGEGHSDPSTGLTGYSSPPPAAPVPAERRRRSPIPRAPSAPAPR